MQENALPSSESLPNLPSVLFSSSPLTRMSIRLNSFSASSTAATMVWGCLTSMDRGKHCWPVAATNFFEAWRKKKNSFWDSLLQQVLDPGLVTGKQEVREEPHPWQHTANAVGTGDLPKCGRLQPVSTLQLKPWGNQRKPLHVPTQSPYHVPTKCQAGLEATTCYTQLSPWPVIDTAHPKQHLCRASTKVEPQQGIFGMSPDIINL